jgi:hypothetical protein
LEEIQQHLQHTTTLTAAAFQEAADKVRERLSRTAGIHQVDLHQVIETILQQGQQIFTPGAPPRQDVHEHDTAQAWSERGVAWLANLAGMVKTLAGEMETYLQRELDYHTGTVVGTGNFFCTRCDKDLRKLKTGPLPPCSRCHGTVFRRRL